ncbi:alpha/beta hydrolase-fold protein [Mammaliicoccus sciuri]|uniref:Enterochelin esterase n=2 Tax=Sporosarcina newyorkensis TaxID=759851 RepID=A0A1T4Y3X6_9BACL|nr:alpha/beta hydrolase-fold protein [Sporosarcina newyorkensis]EGQ27144.1 acetyl esterase [Sporosarcina newyorkensis 2681]SKA96333.1 Enterochelin esterase [Sporosarcina newyorkensis]
MNPGKIEEIRFYSNELQEEMELLLYLPSHYSPLYKHNVVLASDGKDYFQLGRIGRVAEELMEEELIDPVIIVGIPYKTVPERRRMYHPEGDRHQAYIRFLAHELIQYIDETYPTYQMGSSRMLIGDSLAASISLLTAAKYPNCFGKVVLHSPFVNEHVMEAVKSIQDPAALSIYQVIGQQETAVPTTADGRLDFLTPNRELHELIKEKGFPYFYEELDGDHTWKSWQPDIRRALLQINNL